jgi:tRNA (guanine37-N1)-methyltransferase
MQIDIITLFPEMFKGPFDESIVKRAQNKGAVKINIHNLRDWAVDERGSVDARPYGGGPGMVLRCEPVFAAVEEIKTDDSLVVLLTPQGKLFKQQTAQKLAEQKQLILICGHYEGVDERIRKHLIDLEISIGDYVLTGGEIPAMAVTDAVVRLLPGVLKKTTATTEESFSNAEFNSDNQQTLEHPHYTRPRNYKGYKVPQVLVSGDHKKVAQWRQEQALKRTKKRRPDLIADDK